MSTLSFFNGMLAISKLSVAEKMALLESICESLAGEDVPLSPKQLKLIEHRLEEYRRDKTPGMPVEEAIAEIRAKRK